jgi:hypothetical protein
MYAQALAKAGFAVERRFASGSRAAYVPALRRGELGPGSEYLAPLTEYLRTRGAHRHPPARPTGGRRADGPGAERAAGRHVTAGGEPAIDRDRPDRDRGAQDAGRRVGPGRRVRPHPVERAARLGGPDGCQEDLRCLTGLQDLYGLRFAGLKELGAVSGELIFEALADGTVEVGTVNSSSGGIAAGSLVVLRDNKLLQPAGNILALHAPSCHRRRGRSWTRSTGH